MDKTSFVDFQVVSNISGTKKEEVIETLVNNLDENNYLASKEVFLQDVLERENTLPTYIGYEIGLPHSQSEGVNYSSVTIGRLEEEIKWTEEGEEVNTVFLIAVPNNNEDNLHLKILSKLSRLLMHEEFRNEVRNLDENALIATLNEKVKGELE
ncbi:PTS sugar transporter subunit IIA [Pontibacillus yanchengensis]|uniref:PTS fructose transporter subunit IIABC n=1 Tax=Pontibacillus yanchengensis Y32 TaxID=1385514 RepID=A0A0A2TTU2_9BACI|nr:fructose PTS transporter subunit IIA [Pontibacillus yanchengensis]KGP72690.1 PTS fructose transporter subunit IIABC [Pontibacillus yanchengensis Y32]